MLTLLSIKKEDMKMSKSLMARTFANKVVSMVRELLKQQPQLCIQVKNENITIRYNDGYVVDVYSDEFPLKNYVIILAETNFSEALKMYDVLISEYICNVATAMSSK
jgi:hypothetical protein